MWMRIKPNFIVGRWSRRIVMAPLRSCTKSCLLYVDFDILLHFLEGEMGVPSCDRMVNLRRIVTLNFQFYTFLMNCSRRYARVTINFTVQFLNPCVLKWKKVFRVDWRVLSKPGVTLYYLLRDLRQREIIVRLFLGFLSRNSRWSRPWRRRWGNKFCRIYW
jgi:hypothetical protein